MKAASILTASTIAALFAIACTTTTTTTTTAPDDAGTSSKTGDGDDGDDGGDGKGGEDEDEGKGKDNEKSCADETTLQACGECCAAAHPAGAEIFQNAVNECICNADNCGDVCAGTVACGTPDKQPTQECVTCGNGFAQDQAKLQQACGAAVSTACGSSQECLALNQCLLDSKCDAKK